MSRNKGQNVSEKQRLKAFFVKNFPDMFTKGDIPAHSEDYFTFNVS